ncbi:hypothetical protein H1R20_g8551, partial [Candolleomyces eurysporus]
MDVPDSSFSYLLTSNTAPNPLEHASIEQDIKDTSDKISRLRSQLDELEVRRRRHQALLSPLRRLPLETLGEIFMCTLPSVLGQTERRYVTSLSLVCKDWHCAVLVTHQLWGGIHIEWDELSMNLPYTKVEAWLKRSGNTPRRIKISDHVHRDDSECALANAVVVRLLTEGPSLDQVILECAHSKCPRILVESMESPPNRSASRAWDSVGSLKLFFKLRESTPEGAGAKFLYQLPPVESFELAGPNYSIFNVPSDFLRRLTSFVFRCDQSPFPAHLFDKLKACTNLGALTIDTPFYDYFLEEIYNSPVWFPLLLPNLRTLRLRWLPHSGKVDILQLLQFPSLVNLDISFNQAPIRRNEFGGRKLFQALEPFFNKRAMNGESPLQSLRIHHAVIQPSELADILDKIPTLTHLTLDSVKFDPTALQSIILPELEVLKLLHMPPRFDFEAAFDMHVTEKLQKLELTYFGSKHPKQEDVSGFRRKHGNVVVTVDRVRRDGQSAT